MDIHPHLTNAPQTQVCLRVALFFPGVSLLVLSFLNILIRHTGSSGAIPLFTFFTMLAVWFATTIPLAFSGTCTGGKGGGMWGRGFACVSTKHHQHLPTTQHTQTNNNTNNTQHKQHNTGGLLATKQEIWDYPTRTNQIPRHIPSPHLASNPIVLFLAAGLLPFGTLFVELYFAMSSVWQVCGGCGVGDVVGGVWCGNLMHMRVRKDR